MSGKETTECQGCGGQELHPLFDMGVQPLAENSNGERYPLVLIQCLDCFLVQLSYQADPAVMFQADHPYSTGNSEALRHHYTMLAHNMRMDLPEGSLIVDIGANDGTFLANFTRWQDLTLVAVEPTDQILKAPDQVIKFQAPFTSELARRIAGDGAIGRARYVTAMNVLAHVPDVHDFLDGVTQLLAPGGQFVTENHDFYSITDGLQIDTIYHEHLRYYTVASLSRLLEQHWLRVTRVEQTRMHGGSFRIWARDTRHDWTSDAAEAAMDLTELLGEITGKGHAVYGIGAATRATPLIHFAGLAPYIAYVCEVAGSAKIGTFIPGTDIPVVDEADLVRHQPAYALLFAWHMKDYIVPKLRAAGYRGKFIVPLPKPEVIGD
ncbi:MAG TPA: class I SAM-dependent methyltransferase [Acidobacteriaceae bacterium]|nr:class I SAM-dependent methyltransferase [Acidobacteriaceae bacterium]